MDQGCHAPSAQPCPQNGGFHKSIMKIQYDMTWKNHGNQWKKVRLQNMHQKKKSFVGAEVFLFFHVLESHKANIYVTKNVFGYKT